MNDRPETLGNPLSSFAQTGKAAEETLDAIVLGEADAVVIETSDGPRIYTLRDASEPYRELVERMPGAATVLDAEHTITYCNGGLARMLGREVAGQNFLDLVTPAQRGLAKGLLAAGLESHTAAEMALIHDSGARTPVRVSAGPISFDARPCVALVVTALDDIEALKVSAAELKESERRFRTALANSRVSVFEQDLELRYTWMYNSRLGLTGDEIIGKTDAEIMDPVCAANLTAIKRSVIETGQPSRQEVAAAPPGAPLEYYDLFVEPRYGDVGKIIGVTCAATDITARKRSEEQALKGAALLRTVIEATPDLVWAKDTEGRIILGNQATFDLLGEGDSKKVLGLSAREIVPVPEFAQRMLDNDARIMASGRTDTVEESFGPADRPLIFQVAKSPLHDGAGKVVGLVGVSRNVTEAKKAADALQRSEQRFRLATELSKTVAFTFDRDLRCTWVHGTQTGFGDVAILGKTLDEYFAAESADRLVSLYRRALEGAVIREDVTVLSLAGSTPQVFDVFAEPLRNARNEIIGIIGAANNITERKRVETALRESEERFRIALEASDLGAWDIDLATGKATRSLRHDQVFGYETLQPEWSPEIAARQIVPEDLPVFREAFARSEQTGRLSFEARVRWPDGGIHWIDANGAVINDQEGRVVRMTGVVADITKRKRAEEALRDNQQRSQLATEASGVGIWEWNIATDAIWWDPQMFRIYGIPQTEDGYVNYAIWASSVLPEDLAAQEVLLREHARQGGINRREFRLRRKDNRETRVIQAVETTRTNGQGQVEWVVGTNLDITDRRLAEKQLAESEARFRAAQEASLDAFLIYEPIKGGGGRIVDLKVVYVNPKAAEFCLSTPEQMLGQPISQTIPGAKLAGGLIAQYGRIIESGRAQEYVLDYDADGIKAHFLNLIVPFGPYAAATFRDITAQVESANALAAAKAEAERASEAKSKFLAAASHDLRQPVQSLILLSGLLKRKIASDPKLVEIIGAMESAVHGLNVLLAGILDISRLDAGVVAPEMQPVDVGLLIEQMSEEYRERASKKSLRLLAKPRAVWASSDPALLQRAMRNLIENALKYTAMGGVLIGARIRGERVRIDVVDTGVGVPANHRRKIFEEFYQVHNPGRVPEEGLGLGLAIVSRIAGLLGAEVQMASRVGQGSRFSLLLPLDREGVPTAAPEPASAGFHGRVLLIEDNSIVRFSIAALLGDWGCAHMSAATGEEALDLAGAERWRFDAIIADQRLGGPLTGVATSKEIERRAGRPIPTIVLTGDTAVERIAEMDASGFIVLHKPVDAENLRRELERLLSNR